VFTKPVNKKKGLTRIKRKSPETAKLRQKLSRFQYRQKHSRKIHKNPYGIRKLTLLKYQHIKYQIESIDERFEMRQVFRKRPSYKHRA
jgi:hypothetical protein